VAIAATDLEALKRVTTLARSFADASAPRSLADDELLALEGEEAVESLRRDLLASLDKVDPLIARLEAGPRI
jgi:hypothetical protein